MTVYEIEGIRLAIRPIEDATAGADCAGRYSRRERERMAVREILDRLLGRDAVLGHRDDGSPYIAGRPEVHISVSHSIHWAAVAVGPVPVGVDIEEPREQLRKVAPRVLDAGELAVCGGSLDGMLRAWVLKEALYKLNPCPETCDFRKNISLDPLRSGSVAARLLFEMQLPSPEAFIALVGRL